MRLRGPDHPGPVRDAAPAAAVAAPPAENGRLAAAETRIASLERQLDATREALAAETARAEQAERRAQERLETLSRTRAVAAEAQEDARDAAEALRALERMLTSEAWIGAVEGRHAADWPWVAAAVAATTVTVADPLPCPGAVACVGGPRRVLQP